MYKILIVYISQRVDQSAREANFLENLFFNSICPSLLNYGIDRDLVSGLRTVSKVYTTCTEITIQNSILSTSASK